MGTLTSASIIPSKIKTSSFTPANPSFLHHRIRRVVKTNHSIVPVARLIGPAIFEASKLKVLFLGVDEEEKLPLQLPRTYTLTHSDITSKLTLTVSHTINNSQVLKAFVHGDKRMFKKHPQLEDALVWVYFHSNRLRFNKVECWGPLIRFVDPSKTTISDIPSCSNKP